MKIVAFCAFIILFPFSLLGHGWPWGKDAAIAISRREPVKAAVPSASARLAYRLIRFHRTVISPADGPRSHFWPSSSQYTMGAVLKYGFPLGVIYGCDRLMRENSDPWIYPHTRNPKGEWMKSDPVP